MNLELWKLIATVGGVLITTVTGPIIWAVRAEFKVIRAEMTNSELRLETQIKADLSAAETRLAERIDMVEKKVEALELRAWR